MFDNPTSYYTGRNDAGRTTLHPRDYHRKPAIDTGMRGGGRAWNRSRRQELGNVLGGSSAKPVTRPGLNTEIRASRRALSGLIGEQAKQVKQAKQAGRYEDILPGPNI